MIDVPLPTKNWQKRILFGLVLFCPFLGIVYHGSVPTAVLFILVQILCYKEVLNIVFEINNRPILPRFFINAWYFFTVWNYCFMGEIVREKFPDENSTVNLIFKHSRFKSFILYFIGIIHFVLSLAGKYDVKRFRLLAILHVLLMVITLPCYLLIKCLFEAMIWAILPLSSVALNDIFAYVFGKFFGRTPLIHVSPNKTWEGYVGGAVCTVVCTILLSDYLCQFKHFTCPTQYNDMSNFIEINRNCNSSYYFQPELNNNFEVSPFLIDSFYISLFASVLAPFAGFFASGFKRAFNLKDFSNTIPGHGGIIDRFDCQFLMGVFVYVYLSTFVKNSRMIKMFKRVMKLSEEEQLELYNSLRNSLTKKKLL